MKVKFKNFLNDKSEYEAAESYWAELFEEYNSQLPPQCRWTPWFNSLNGNGDKIMDGNPILSRCNSELKKGLRIIQDGDDSHQSNAKLVGAWMDKYDESIDELVIACVLTDETESICQLLIKAYVVDSLPVYAMQKLIDDLCNINP